MIISTIYKSANMVCDIWGLLNYWQPWLAISVVNAIAHNSETVVHNIRG